MKPGINFIAGLVNSAWSVIVNLAAVPFYIKFLGIESYGLVGFFITMQTVLQLLDMGITPTINREVARLAAVDKIGESGALVHTLAVVYWCIAALIALAIAGLAPLIAEYWLESTMTVETVTRAVGLMGLVIAFRWPKAIYQGVLVGAEYLTIASAINAVMVTVSAVGAVLVLAFYSPTIESFFIWHAAVALIFSFIMRSAAWRTIGRERHFKFDVEKLKSVWRFTAGMSGVTVSGLVLLQLDKVLLSKLTTLEDFGRYTLAAVVATGLSVFLLPLFNVIYPRISALLAGNRENDLVAFYRNGTLMFMAMFFPIAIFVAIFVEDILFLWTSNRELAVNTAPIASFFILGTMLNGIMHFPYALQLAYGQTRLPISINLILILILIPALGILAHLYGSLGGAIAWAVTNFVYVIIGTVLTHRILLRGLGATWLLSDVCFPITIPALMVGVGGLFVLKHEFHYIANLAIGLGLVIGSFLSFLVLSRRLRHIGADVWKGRAAILS